MKRGTAACAWGVLLWFAMSHAPACAAEFDRRYQGRTLAEVIDEFRANGIPLVYSTHLVSDGLVVSAEPDADRPLDIVAEILAPHGLVLRREQGLYLVVREISGAERTGNILLIMRKQTGWLPLSNVAITATPELHGGEELSPGVHQFSNVAARKYRVVVDADGFATATSIVAVAAGETQVVELAFVPERPEIETITVSSSRYDISRNLLGISFLIDQRSLQNLPDLGDDPLRATHRLPGVASGGLSARPNFRGGEDNETAIILNGLELFDPYHARDFSNFFSVIDPRTVDGIEVFTGGFPVRYGDRMSGIVMLETIDPGRARRTELGVSLFNTSLLSAGRTESGRVRWLGSARRGNLDLIVDRKYGVPGYHDLFGHLSFDISASSEVSANAMFAKDSISVILSDQPDDVERAESDTSNLQLWTQLQTQWSDALKSTSLLYYNDFSNERAGVVNDPERVVAIVDDRRVAVRYGFRQDWDFTASDRHLLQWGFEIGHETASYRYRAEVNQVESPFALPGAVLPVDSDLAASPSGNAYAAYVSDRWKVGARSFVELGLRWDDETYTNTLSDGRLSPRISYFYATESGTEFRLSWGRYSQAAQIHELQIADGVTEFWDAQRADHVIAGLQFALADDLSMRLEIYQKDIYAPRTRYENLFDPLELLPEVEPDRIQIVPTSARARGVELSLDRRGEGPWSWWASYTLSETTDVVAGNSERRNWDQRYALHAGINFSSEKWDFGAALNAHSGWPTTNLFLVNAPGDPPYELVLGPRNADRFAAFVTVDARISRRFFIGDSLLTTFFELSNALNRHNPCCVDFDVDIDENGQPYLDRQEDRWLPIIPSLGFLLEF